MRKDGAQSIEVERAPLPQELVLQSSVLRNEPVSEYACVRGPSMFCCCDCCLVAYAYARLATRPVGWIDAIAGAPVSLREASVRWRARGTVRVSLPLAYSGVSGV